MSTGAVGYPFVRGKCVVPVASHAPSLALPCMCLPAGGGGRFASRFCLSLVLNVSLSVSGSLSLSLSPFICHRHGGPLLVPCIFRRSDSIAGAWLCILPRPGPFRSIIFVSARLSPRMHASVPLSTTTHAPSFCITLSPTTARQGICAYTAWPPRACPHGLGIFGIKKHVPFPPGASTILPFCIALCQLPTSFLGIALNRTTGRQFICMYTAWPRRSCLAGLCIFRIMTHPPFPPVHIHSLPLCIALCLTTGPLCTCMYRAPHLQGCFVFMSTRQSSPMCNCVSPLYWLRNSTLLRAILPRVPPTGRCVSISVSPLELSLIHI